MPLCQPAARAPPPRVGGPLRGEVRRPEQFVRGPRAAAAARRPERRKHAALSNLRGARRLPAPPKEEKHAALSSLLAARAARLKAETRRPHPTKSGAANIGALFAWRRAVMALRALLADLFQAPLTRQALNDLE